MRIEIRMMGTPGTTADGAPVRFKYQKSEAIFYYIAYHRSAERYRIMSLFWPDESEEKARKNLRNALYSIRQAFDRAVLTNSGQRLIGFDEDIEIVTDLDTSPQPGMMASGPRGEFLEDFIVKDAAEFDDWIQQIRTRLRDQRLSVLSQMMEDCLKQGENPENLCRELLRLDPYDEKTVRILMRHFGRLGQFSRSIELYTHLERVLEEELSLKPEPETTLVFQQSVEQRRTSGKGNGSAQAYFYGRNRELEMMDSHSRRVREMGGAGIILITGEAGIGKSTLLKRYLQSFSDRDMSRIGICCYEGDEHHLLKVWFPLVLRLGEMLLESGQSMEEYPKEILGRVFPTFMNTAPAEPIYEMEKQQQIPFPVIVRVVTDLLNRVTKRTPLILYLEDVQWMDDWSLALLRHLVFDPEQPTLLVMATSRISERDLADRGAGYDGRHESFLSVSLSRYDRRETEDFIELYPGRPSVTAEMRGMIFAESEGNPLMLTEILRGVMEQGCVIGMPLKVRNVIASRYLGLSQEARKLADLLSVFSESADWGILRSLYGKPDLELLEMLEELLRGDFIRETESETHEVRYRFTHQKLKSFVYEQQSIMKRRMLHKRVADFHRTQLSGTPSDRLLYPFLIYHYERSGDRRPYLEFRIRSLYEYLEISHELFPRIRDKSVMALGEQPEYQQTYVTREIRDIEAGMQAIAEMAGSSRLRLEYLNMIGRYQILQGDSETGIRLIREMIQLAGQTNETEFALKGYLQLIYNAINQRDIPEMEVLITQAFRQFRHNADKAEIGILIRLKGYLMTLKDRFGQGEALLRNAAAIFERPEYRDQYALNRVASYYYLGESRRLQNDFLGADSWYLGAEDICRRQGFGSHLALLKSSRGIAAYDCGRYDEAHAYLREAVEAYDRDQFKWGQITAYGYWGLLCIRRGSGKEGQRYLRQAEKLSESSGHTQEKGLMLRIKAEICCLRKQGFPMNGVSENLCQEANRFCQRAISFFEQHESFTYERKILRDIRQICGDCSSYREDAVGSF